jgi:hypothetical protein
MSKQRPPGREREHAMKHENEEANLKGHAQLAQTLRLLLTNGTSSLAESILYSQFRDLVWDSSDILRKYADESEIQEVFDFASGLVSQGKSAAEAAGETIDLLSRANKILAGQIRKPRVAGLLCPVRSISSLPHIVTEEGFRLGPFSVFRCSQAYVNSLQERFRDTWEMGPTADEFGNDISQWIMDLPEDLERDFSFSHASRDCCTGRICFLAETAQSPHTTWPGPVGLGGMYDVNFYDSQILERFRNLVRYVYPEFEISLSCRIDLDYEARIASVRTPAESCDTTLLGKPLPNDLATKLQALHRVLTLAPKVELARCLEAAVFWVGSAKSRTASSIAGSNPLDTASAVDYLKFMIALESLLVFAEHNITEAVSSRVAHLLWTEYGKVEYFKKRVRRLYNIRSRIVHDGEWYVSPPDLAELEDITRKVVDTLLENPERWASKQELSKWVELKEWVTSDSSTVQVPAKKVRQWMTAIEEARS